VTHLKIKRCGVKLNLQYDWHFPALSFINYYPLTCGDYDITDKLSELLINEVSITNIRNAQFIMAAIIIVVINNDFYSLIEGKL
jgi:hypothetical protein